ncbi:unnamed protein product [Didymodactylos carnosus]|uniref:Uncharacterized protein n=1 Tax=Didymodactylos carnosus TaxID=1234261 RepID=A0A815XSD7_9BILA|nr:unnamed protein product [Didymodactylos carnosus]CAF1561853.1 unnamed protein product [Didymodactylos carnosus]CAF3873261.1 unnamed protein product [Didymodactylos carnosus]CAF4423380.1 unnamed protein product [Didymodactylos carnosus]
MENETSIEKKEASILHDPQHGQAKDLYWACRKGDIDAVQHILSSTPYTDINCLEQNGSTTLHAACFFGHSDIVPLLLHQHGVMRY